MGWTAGSHRTAYVTGMRDEGMIRAAAPGLAGRAEQAR